MPTTLAASLGALLLCVVYVAACVALGARAQRWLLGPAADDATPQLASLGTAFLLGQGLLAQAWTLLGLAGWFTAWPLAAVLVAAAALGAGPAGRLFGRLRAGVAAGWAAWRAEPWAWRVLPPVVSGVILIYLLASFLPPTGYDPLSFYLAFPQYMAHCARLVALPGYEVFSPVGLQGELHFAALMVLGNATAAKLFVWPTALGAGAMLLALGARLGLGWRGQWLALALLFTSSAFTERIYDGKVDNFAAAMGLAACYWAWAAGRANRRALLLCGLFSGLAIVAKLSYLAGLPLTIAVLLAGARWVGGPDAPWRERARAIVADGAVWGLALLVPIAVHVLKNQVLLGEPLAPFITAGPKWAEQAWYGPAVVQRYLLGFPVALTFGRYYMQAGGLSAAWLALLPLLWLPRRQAPLVGVWWVFGAAALGVAAFTATSPATFAPRYIMAPVLLLLVPVALAAERVSRAAPRPRRLGGAVLACLLVVIGVQWHNLDWLKDAGWRYLRGRKSSCRYSYPWAACELAQETNARVRPGERVWIAMYLRYWLRPALLTESFGQRGDEVAALERLPTEAAQWEFLVAQGVQYVLLDGATHGMVSPDGARWAVTLARGRLSSDHLPPTVRAECVLAKEGFALYRLYKVAPAGYDTPRGQP